MNPFTEWFLQEFPRTYVVSFPDGSRREFAATHVSENADGDVLIWNDLELVTGFKKGEYLEIQNPTTPRQYRF